MAIALDESSGRSEKTLLARTAPQMKTIAPPTPATARKHNCATNPPASPEPTRASTVTTIPTQKSRRLPNRET